MRWVLAVPEDARYRTLDEFRSAANKRVRKDPEHPMAVWTELANVSGTWLAQNGIDAQPHFSWGSTEAKAGFLGEAIIEATETGASLRAHGLRELAEVLVSTTQLIVNRRAYQRDPAIRTKADAIKHLLVGALRGRSTVQLTVVYSYESGAEEVLSILPPSSHVVVSPDVEPPRKRAVALIPESLVQEILPRVIAAGAESAWIVPVGVVYEREEIGDPAVRNANVRET